LMAGPSVGLVSHFDQHMTTLFPDYIADQRLLRLQLYAMGATEDTLVDYMNEVNDAFHEHLAASGGEVQILAVRAFANVLSARVDFFAAYCRRSLDGMTTTTFGTFQSHSHPSRYAFGRVTYKTNVNTASTSLTRKRVMLSTPRMAKMSCTSALQEHGLSLGRRKRLSQGSTASKSCLVQRGTVSKRVVTLPYSAPDSPVSTSRFSFDLPSPPLGILRL
jgi:hypothetical protein